MARVRFRFRRETDAVKSVPHTIIVPIARHSPGSLGNGAMADTTTKKLLGLLQSDQGAHVRAAAALVLAEIGQRDQDAAAQLCARLDDADGMVRQQAIRSIGKLKIEQALPKLLERVQAGGEESEAAAHAVAGLGARGTRALQGLMDKVAPGLRRRIAGALAAAGTSS